MTREEKECRERKGRTMWYYQYYQGVVLSSQDQSTLSSFFLVLIQVDRRLRRSSRSSSRSSSQSSTKINSRKKGLPNRRSFLFLYIWMRDNCYNSYLAFCWTIVPKNSICSWSMLLCIAFKYFLPLRP